jgi:uncharacterized surface protein with fasciclin (FAS1) repeats
MLAIASILWTVVALTLSPAAGVGGRDLAASPADPVSAAAPAADIVDTAASAGNFNTLVAAVKQALLDPEVLRAVGDITFNSAQRAERE